MEIGSSPFSGSHFLSRSLARIDFLAEIGTRQPSPLYYDSVNIPSESFLNPVAEDAEGLERLTRLLSGGGVLVLTGAGCSTESGIPDYRDLNGNWKRRQPVRYQDFVRSDAVRRRYWARSFFGWHSWNGRSTFVSW